MTRSKLNDYERDHLYRNGKVAELYMDSMVMWRFQIDRTGYAHSERSIGPPWWPGCAIIKQTRLVI